MHPTSRDPPYPNRTKAEERIFYEGLPPNVKECLCFHSTRRNLGLLLVSKGGRENIITNTLELNNH
jgi:hypothetical protein